MESEFLEILNNYITEGVEANLTTSLKDLGLDSMASIDLLLELEDQFNVSFPDELLTEETFETGQRLLDALKKLLSTEV
ncbi:Acyl carrier protein [Bacillus subtilis]